MPETDGQQETGPGSTAPVEAARVSGNRNALIIVAAVLVVMALAGLVVAAVFVFFLGPALDGPSSSTATVPAVTTSTPDPEASEVVEPEPASLPAVFTFRDIFDPLVKPLPAEEESAAPESTNGESTTTTQEDTLMLVDIVSTDDGYEAVLSWNGQTYTLGPGESIPDSPWEVLSVSSTEVVMLYGDDRVTLTVGASVTK